MKTWARTILIGEPNERQSGTPDPFRTSPSPGVLSLCLTCLLEEIQHLDGGCYIAFGDVLAYAGDIITASSDRTNVGIATIHDAL